MRPRTSNKHNAKLIQQNKTKPNKTKHKAKKTINATKCMHECINKTQSLIKQADTSAVLLTVRTAARPEVSIPPIPPPPLPPGAGSSGRGDRAAFKAKNSEEVALKYKNLGWVA
jgi:hypothetical protein